MPRIPKSEHWRLPWRIREFTSDFEPEDVWLIRTPGAGPDDFPVMLDVMQAMGGTDTGSWASRFLFKIRWKLGSILGWDEQSTGLGKRVPSLKERLYGDLIGDPEERDAGLSPFTAVYETENERVDELANKTVHVIRHISWVRGQDGDYELRMSGLLKPNGWFGRMYMAFIKPFQLLVVYPSLTRQFERAWLDRDRILQRPV